MKGRQMDKITRIGTLVFITLVGLAAVTVLTSGLSVLAAGDEIDLIARIEAPTYVALGSTYEVNISYANKGTVAAPDNWVRVTLPPGTQFVEATYAGGAPRPPDEIDGNVLTWTVTPLVADSTWSHILVSLQTDEGLSEGEALTVVADVATSAPEPDITNNTASVTTIASSMGGSFKRVQARHVMPGDVLTYTISINLAQQYSGGANGRWVVLTDTLPFSHQVRFLAWSSEVTGTLVEGNMLQWQGRVYAGEPLQLQYRLGVEGDVGPGTVISNVAMLGWTGHHLQLGPVTTVVTLPHGVLGLGASQGGELSHSYGVTVEIPPGAVTDTTRFQLEPLFTDTCPIAPATGLLFAHRAFGLSAFRFGVPVHQFNAPLTVTMSYGSADVSGFKQETLRLWTRARPEGPWSLLDAPAGMMSGTMAFTTTHLSQFALFGEAKYHSHLPLVAK